MERLRAPPLKLMFIMSLSEFTSVSRVEIVDTTFVSFTNLTQLICALPNLAFLTCIRVDWTKDGYNLPAFKKHGVHLRLKGLFLESCPIQAVIDWIFSAIAIDHLRTVMLPSLDFEHLKAVSRLLQGVGNLLLRLTIGFDPSLDSETLNEAIGKCLAYTSELNTHFSQLREHIQL